MPSSFFCMHVVQHQVAYWTVNAMQADVRCAAFLYRTAAPLLFSLRDAESAGGDLGQQDTPYITLEFTTFAMDPSWSPAAACTSDNTFPEPDSNSSSQSVLHATPEPEPDRRITSGHLISKLETLKEALGVCNKAHSCKEQNGWTVPTRLLYVGRHGPTRSG